MHTGLCKLYQLVTTTNESQILYSFEVPKGVRNYFSFFKFKRGKLDLTKLGQRMRKNDKKPILGWISKIPKMSFSEKPRSCEMKRFTFRVSLKITLRSSRNAFFVPISCRLQVLHSLLLRYCFPSESLRNRFGNKTGISRIHCADAKFSKIDL